MNDDVIPVVVRLLHLLEYQHIKRALPAGRQRFEEQVV